MQTVAIESKSWAHTQTVLLYGVSPGLGKMYSRGHFVGQQVKWTVLFEELFIQQNKRFVL